MLCRSLPSITPRLATAQRKTLELSNFIPRSPHLTGDLRYHLRYHLQSQCGAAAPFLREAVKVRYSPGTSCLVRHAGKAHGEGPANKINISLYFGLVQSMVTITYTNPPPLCTAAGGVCNASSLITAGCQPVRYVGRPWCLGPPLPENSYWTEDRMIAAKSSLLNLLLSCSMPFTEMPASASAVLLPLLSCPCLVLSAVDDGLWRKTV